MDNIKYLTISNVNIQEIQHKHWVAKGLEQEYHMHTAQSTKTQNSPK